MQLQSEILMYPTLSQLVESQALYPVVFHTVMQDNFIQIIRVPGTVSLWTGDIACSIVMLILMLLFLGNVLLQFFIEMFHAEMFFKTLGTGKRFLAEEAEGSIRLITGLEHLFLNKSRLRELVDDLDKSTVLVGGADISHSDDLSRSNTEGVAVMKFLTISSNYLVLVVFS